MALDNLEEILKKGDLIVVFPKHRCKLGEVMFDYKDCRFRFVQRIEAPEINTTYLVFKHLDCDGDYAMQLIYKH